MATTKINLTKHTRTINVNVVSVVPMKNFQHEDQVVIRKFCNTKISRSIVLSKSWFGTLSASPACMDSSLTTSS